MNLWYSSSDILEMPLQRRLSGGGATALDLDQFHQLEGIAENDDMVLSCCLAPKVIVLFFLLNCMMLYQKRTSRPQNPPPSFNF